MFYYRRLEKFEPIGQKRIPTKCPNCGNTDVLELTFYQKEVTTGFIINMTKKISGILTVIIQKVKYPRCNGLTV